MTHNLLRKKLKQNNKEKLRQVFLPNLLNMKKNTLILCAILSVIGLGLAIPFDLSFSQTIYDQSNFLGLFGEAFGELPGILVGVFGCAALLLTYKKDSKYSKISSFIFGSIFLVLLSIMAAFLPSHYIEMPTVVVVIVALVYAALALFIVKKTPESKYPLLRRLAWVAVLTLLTETLMINLVKFGWSRIRFRDLVDNTELFTAWFIPNGFSWNTDHMSFPSGHVGNASVILFITLLPSVYLKLSKYQNALLMGSFVWIVLIAISRIIMGAHFISDTIVGMWVTIISLIVYQKRFKIEQ